MPHRGTGSFRDWPLRVPNATADFRFADIVANAQDRTMRFAVAILLPAFDTELSPVCKHDTLIGPPA